MDDWYNYDEDNLIVFGGDDDDVFPVDPPEWHGIVVVVGLLVLGVMLTITIIYCSRFQEQYQKNQQEGTIYFLLAEYSTVATTITYYCGCVLWLHVQKESVVTL